jgi:hypothetical protein
MLNASSRPPKIRNKYAKVNNIFILVYTAPVNNKQKNTIIMNSLWRSNDRIFCVLAIKLQNVNIIKNKKIVSQSSTLIK